MIKRLQLTEIEQEVLACIDLGARQTCVEVSQQTGFALHTVRRAIDRLKTRIGLAPNCWLHPYKLGAVPYRIFITLATINEKDRQAFLKWLQAAPQVTWIGELSGIFHYGIAVYARGAAALQVFLEEIDNLFGDLLVRKTIGVTTELAFLRMKFMTQRKYLPLMLAYESTEDRISLDDKDFLLLKALCAKPLSTHREISQQVGLPASTVTYRLAAFEKTGTVLGCFFQFDYALLGLQSYLLLISAGGVGGRIYKPLRKFALNHPNIVMFGRCIGSWDFELQILVEHPKQLVYIEQSIHSLCGRSISEIQALNWIADLKG